ncbi:hypothetical protein GIB67_016655 [Kingdonia uniflora]|uniref:No apical meristem-associated C-terminal domain-containing protein n=1 Tax=Kingdonia uniflora TaxID=39325 RepID=A0A7J7MZ28_9MAGN|nr:hypothetical protein GIB67_016655 [Kingdonia uniflora]
MQVLEDSEFLDETDDAGMHWTDADFTCLARAWITTFVQTNGRTKGFTFYQNVNIAFNRDPECPTRRSCGSTKLQWYALNVQCVAYKGIVAQERFRNSHKKIEEDRENDAHKMYKGLNGGNDFKHCEAHKILAREPRWANLRDDGLNHAVNIPRNIAKRTSNNSSPGSRPISQKLYRKNLASQKAIEGVTASGSDVQKILDELRLEKIQAKEEKERRRAETMQHWQAKMDLEQAKEDRKIMEKDLCTLSGYQLQYYLQRQAEIMERLAKRGGPGT